ncbi:hypothetical protein I3843_01G244000 [Carya illinoinensis]|uniref:Uncharacterized protein n=1 Tax=Carya illinoinensis TaxID=32201 RepID=A0A8T1RU07_CARIL|nr:uncharacterized protein LOC122284841 [Carya illinoinensis]KAG6669552.1 hypothetical protein CIPAW_01G252000 [Carya illinoinensis]KAG7998153.1 hypothetical protein I3843_01G244000 [Carya illinoinensis]
MCDEKWAKDAMTDDSLVAYVLLRLNQEQPPTQLPLPPPPAPAKPALHLDWTVRQRRSKSGPRTGDGKKKAELARASPTTPLSWSGATSVSGGGLEGFEESSRSVKRTDVSRSKVVVRGETTTNKRSRKKKSLAELRDEESFLLKERRTLKSELAALRLTVEKQRDANESFKKMKLDLQSQQMMKATTSMASKEALSDGTQKMEEVCSSALIFPSDVACANLDAAQSPCQLKSSPMVVQEVRDCETSSMLPDLNLPLEEDYTSKISYGMS